MELARNLFDQSSTTAVEEHPKDTSTTSEMDLTAASRSETTRDAHPAKAQRWAGLTRSVSGWDNLRKVVRHHSAVFFLANSCRIQTCGSRMETAKSIYTRWGHLVEVHHSVCLYGRFGKRNVALC